MTFFGGAEQEVLSFTGTLQPQTVSAHKFPWETDDSFHDNFNEISCKFELIEVKNGVGHVCCGSVGTVSG